MIKKMIIATSLMLNLASFSLNSASAQGQPDVSVVNLGVQPGSNGTQMVLTPKGYLVPLPGAGVNGNVVQIYMGSTGGFWYVDRNGQTVDLTSYVQQVRAAQNAQAQQAKPPQYSPYPTEYASNTTSSSTSGSSGSAVSAVGTAAAAGLGAMAGSAIANTGYYNNVPYGAPMYYGNDGHRYYDDQGKGVFVNDDGEINKKNVYAANNIKKVNQQEQAQQLSAQRQAHEQSQQQYAQQQKQQYQQQQQWYQTQRQDQNKAQAWQQQSAGENPFVRQGGGQREASGGDREAGGRQREASGRERGERDFGGIGGGNRGGGRAGGGGRRGR